MKWIDRLFQRFAGSRGHRVPPPIEQEIRGLLDRLGESPELLLRELEERPDCPDDEAFSQFLSNRCDRTEKKRILDHILTCPACLAAVDDLTGEARLNARTETRETRPVSQPGRIRRPWVWGLGYGAPAAAFCIFLAVVFLQPSVRMDLEVTRNALRTEGVMSVADGGLLHEGDRFRVEISARKDGYFFLYAWNKAQGGKFLFPILGFSDDNRIRKGQSVFVPDRKGWLLEDTVPGLETFFLLFSDRSVASDDISLLEDRLAQAGTDRSAIEKQLEKLFSIEQRLSCHVE